MLMTGLTVATRNCQDTVSFTFRSGAPEVPGYSISYQPGPFVQAGSGTPVPVAGNAFLVVKLNPATGFDFTTGQKSYTGPARLTPARTAFVVDLVRTGDFESVTTWVIGLRDEVPFIVQAAGAPNHRVTITFG
jgi:hypothetical protein